jgi:flagellar motor switch protein FliN
MSDILSQDQIDALLNSQGFGGDTGGGDAARGNPNDIFAVLLKVYDTFCEQAGTVISTVLNKNVAFKTELCEQGLKETIAEKQPSVLLLLKVPLKGEVEGFFYIIIEKKNVAILSDLMMMGDGTAEYSEDHKDAVAELFNQVMGAFTNIISGEWGGSVNTDTIELAEFDTDNPSLEIADHEMILISQSIEEMGDAYISVLVPRDLSRQIVDKAAIVTGSDDTGVMADSVGLNVSELDDLASVTSFDTGGSGGGGATFAMGGGAAQTNIEMLLDIDLDVSIELGNSMLSIKRILELAPGSIVELERMAGEPVDLLVNNKVVAKGEVVVIDENFGIRIVSLVSPEERIRSLR